MNRHLKILPILSLLILTGSLQLNFATGKEPVKSIQGKNDREAYLKAAGAKLDNWKGIIANLKQSSVMAVTARRRLEIERTVLRMEQTTRELRNRLADLRVANAKDWSAHQELIEFQMIQLQKEYDRSMAE